LLKIYYELLELELKGLKEKNAKFHDINIDLLKDELQIKFKTSDFVAYKIIINSINRYIEVMKKTLDIIENF